MDDGEISKNLRRTAENRRSESNTAAAVAVSLVLRAATFRKSVKDLHPADDDQDLLNGFITQIFSDEDDFYISLADVCALPSLDVDSVDDTS